MEWGKTTTHILQRRQSVVPSWQYQPNIPEEKNICEQKGTLWIRLAMRFKFWHTWRLLPLTPGAQGEHLAHLGQLSQLSQLSHICFPCLPSRWVSLIFYTPLCYDGSVDVQADLRRKLHDFIIWSWSKQWEILIVVISKSCSWWSELEEFLKLRKLVINDWVHVLPRLVSRDGERVAGHSNDMYPFRGIFVGRFKYRKLGGGEGVVIIERRISL